MIDNQLFYILLPVAFIVGAVFGSFVSVASYRLPRGEEIVFKPSHCPHCAAVLETRDLFPIFSWVLQRGRCRHCDHTISPRYPLIEGTLGTVFVGLLITYGVSWQTLLLMLLATELAILIVTDLEHTIIPDSVQIALLLTGLAWCILHHAIWKDVLVMAAGGLFLGLALHYGYKWLRKKDGLGWADVKFLCVAGIWLSLPSFISFIFFAGLLGTCTGLLWHALKRGPLFPFGPALAVSLFINVLFPDLLQQLL